MSELKSIDGILLCKMLKNGYLNLKKNIEIINNLNVFPVPDGDTGTNMFLTIKGGITAEPSEEGVGKYLADFCRGILFSARGNSGIIFSQYLKGFSDSSREYQYFDTESFAKSLGAGVTAAYGSVLVPTEGTMLTVVREAAESLTGKKFDGFSSFFDYYILKMKQSLERTPDLLPCLREAGVVDSGGTGILCFFEGMRDAIEGIFYTDSDSGELSLPSNEGDMAEPEDLLKYGYCTDLMLRLNKETSESQTFSTKEITDFLSRIGDSLVTFRDGNRLKVHVHTKKPGDVLNFLQKYGEFLSLKIENMSLQSMSATLGKASEKKQIALVAVASGEGIIDYYKDSGTDAVIDGGQTKNPSVEDFINAFNSVNAEKIICFPNNGNTVLAANKSAEEYSDAQVTVIPSKSIAEGLAAISIFNPADTFENIISDMKFAIKGVTTAYVTKSTKSCEMDGVSIAEGDYIGFTDGKIFCSCETLNETAVKLFNILNENEEIQVVTVFYGENVSETQAAEFADAVTDQNPFTETGIINGRQKIYDYIISLE